MRRHVLTALAGLALLISAPAWSDNSQQTKMSTCNADASSKGLAGADRNAYMKACLSGGS